VNVCFVGLGTSSLGIDHLSAWLRQHGHSTCMVFDPGLFDEASFLQLRRLHRLFSRRQRVARAVVASRPGLVAFSVVTDTVAWAVDLAERIEALAPELPVVFGGVHPSLVPERVLERGCVDFLVQGEGEGALLDLVRQLEAGEVQPTPNLWYRRGSAVVSRPPRPLVDDLSALPLPDKHIYDGALRINERYSIATGRGCPYTCSYCAHNGLRRLYPGQRYTRRRNPDHVLAELERAEATEPLRYVKFEDDIFTLDRGWLEAFLPAYRERVGAPFGCIVHPRFVDDAVARLLADTGCADVEIGVQSMDEGLRHRVLGRGESNAEVLAAFETLERHGLRFIVDHIFDLPGEGDAGLRSAIDAYTRFSQLIRVTCFHLAYYPRTDIVQAGLEAGLLDPAAVARIENGELDLYFYRDERQHAPASKLQAQAEVLFALLPLLPVAARPLLAGPLLPGLHRIPPASIVPLMGLVGLARRDPFLAGYLKFYADHLHQTLRGDLRAVGRRVRSG
jgi:anaerobic magnesium-protoporphyrin IX monomethyl ester cyclase